MNGYVFPSLSYMNIMHSTTTAGKTNCIIAIKPMFLQTTHVLRMILETKSSCLYRHNCHNLVEAALQPTHYSGSRYAIPQHNSYQTPYQIEGQHQQLHSAVRTVLLEEHQLHYTDCRSISFSFSLLIQQKHLLLQSILKGIMLIIYTM